MNIRKIVLTMGMALYAVSSMMAAPAKRGVRTFTQSNGSVISLNLAGDEFFHTFTTLDGLSVARGEDGDFHYLTPEGLSEVKAQNPEDRTPEVQAYLAAISPEMSVANIAKARKNAINARKAPARNVVERRASQVPNNGSPRVPVILVQYKDVKFKDADPNATFNDFFNTGEKSARQYFVDQSNGKFTPQFDVYGPYTLNSSRATYGGNDYWGNDKGVGKMVAEGCNAADSQMNFKNYDNDGDGICDVVIVLYAGDGEASSYDDDCENAVWPMQWELSASDYGKNLKLDNTTVDKFAVFNELNGSDLSKIDGVGTFCHEFSHCLDLPDFYDTQYAGHFGMADWSLLDSGCYNDDGYTPIGYTAYEKEFMGWIEIEEATENTLYSLPVLNQKSAATDKAVKLTNPSNKNEYFIIENRTNQGWDLYMPAEGLLIYHVTYDASVWDSNTVNDGDMQRMTPVPADGRLKLDSYDYYGETYYYANEEDLKGDLWPYGNATEFTDESDPAAKLNLGSGKYLGKPVTEMTRQTDGSISFWCMKAAMPTIAVPTGLTHSVLSNTSAEISWTPGDDNDATYTLEIRPHRDITCEEVISTTFNNDSHGWETEGFTEIDKATGSVRMGSTKQLGGVISPKFNAIDGDENVTVMLNAKNYSNDNTTLLVSLLDKNLATLSEKEVKLSGSFADYTVLLAGAKGECYVEIATTAKKSRAYLKSATVFVGDATETEKARAGVSLLPEGGVKSRVHSASASADGAAIVITDINGTSYTVIGLAANARYDYKVKAVSKNPDVVADSKWSPSGLLDLGMSTAVEIVEAPETAAAAEYFTLQGIRLNTVPTVPGIYIEHRNGQSRKILVK